MTFQGPRRDTGSPPSGLTRRLALALGVAAAAGHVGGEPAAAGKRRRRNPCSGKNWCVDRSQTCGESGTGKCLVEAFGGNVCAEILFQAKTCADCAPPGCIDCVCALAAGGGDRCNNGATGYDFICARPVTKG